MDLIFKDEVIRRPLTMRKMDLTYNNEVNGLDL
jgi:hypothetical protein